MRGGTPIVQRLLRAGSARRRLRSLSAGPALWWRSGEPRCAAWDHGGKRTPPPGHPQDAFPNQQAGEGKQGPEGRAAGLRAESCATGERGSKRRWEQRREEPRQWRGRTSWLSSTPAWKHRGRSCSGTKGADRYQRARAVHGTHACCPCGISQPGCYVSAGNGR